LVSAQLTRLARQGVIAKVPHVSGKLGFQIAERFFGLWYMMRASRRLRRKLFWLAVCVQELYGQDEFERQAAALLTTTDAESHDAAKLFAFAEASQNATMKRRLERRAVSIVVRASESEPQWEGLDLEGIDRDLKAHADHARRLAQVHRTVREHIRPPEGMTPAQCADAIAGSPLDSIAEKEQVAAAIASGTDLPPGLAATPRTINPVEEPLYRAVRDGEIVAFRDAKSADDIDDILVRVSEPYRPIVLACIAGCACTVASDDAFARPGPIDIGLAVIWSFGQPTAMARIAKALARVDDDSGGYWQHARVWRLAVLSGWTREIAALLREHGLHERALPLYEALLAISDGKLGDLIHLAPEVRRPTEQYLAEFLAAVEPVLAATPARTKTPAKPRTDRRAARPRTPRTRTSPPRRPRSKR
jgi:hypothetical protein